jgi:hypothetical protein
MTGVVISFVTTGLHLKHTDLMINEVWETAMNASVYIYLINNTVSTSDYTQLNDRLIND